MKKFLHRFFWKDQDTRFVPFLVFFTLQNLAIGLLFLFGIYIPGIAEAPLFHLLDRFLDPPLSAVVWGGALILVFIGHCFEMYNRPDSWGPSVAMAGFLLWSYAFYVYASIFFLMGIFGIVAPQLFFWSWYYIEAKKYRREQIIKQSALDI